MTDIDEGLDLRADTWASLVTGLGGVFDKSETLSFVRRHRLDPATLDALYEEDALAARIVDVPADEMTRVGFTIQSEPFDWKPTMSRLETLQALATIGDAIRWARLYGGSLLVFDVDDGRAPDQPLDLGSARVLIRAHVVEAQYAVPSPGQPVDDPMTYDLGQPGHARKTVHRSRVIRFDGIRTSPGARQRHGFHGWGPSVFDRVLEAVKRLGTVLGYMANVMHEVSLPVIRIAGLRKMLESPDGRTKVQLVLQALKDSMDILHMLAIDAADEFVDISREVRGLVELQGVFENAVTWSTDMPREIVFNVTPGGLNTGENAGPIRAWYDRTAKARGDIVTPAMLRFIEIVDAVDKRQTPAVSTLLWEPLWQPTEQERAAAALTRAQSDAAYHTMGVVDEDEIRRARFETTNEGGFAVAPADEREPANLVALPGALGENEPPELEAEATPAPALDVDKALAVMKAAGLNEISREGAIALLSVAFPQLGPVVERLVPPPAAPPPAAAPGAVPDDEGAVELVQADYDPPAGETLLSAAEVGSRFNVSAAVIRGMHKRGEIGGWKPGGRWRYAASEVAQAAHRPKTPPPTDPTGTPPPAAATP